LQNRYLEEEIKAVHNFEEIVGQSRALTQVLGQVGLVAATSSTVLILGETGTGKEIVARAVHSASERRARPFIKVNCAALPTGLIESELFGHERGAFTGATERRIGRFELAHGGSIFLDEVGELPADVQAKLLRVLQEHEFERVGGRDTIKVDVRIIAATNRDLGAMASRGTFRSDLYYRLNVFPITVPPLRERIEDVPLLVHYFASRYAGQIGKRITRVPANLMERLCAYAWPGNVRELEHMIERAVILSSGPELDVSPDALALPKVGAGRPLPIERPRAAIVSSYEREPQPRVVVDGEIRSLEAMEKDHIVAALDKVGWRIEGASGAAALLNMNPSTLRSRMKKLGIRRNLAEA
jgi:transcriptional regulator with GAF, ATPase, and Fis domain